MQAALQLARREGGDPVVVPLPVEPGDVVRAELGGLGALTVRVGA